MPLARCRLNFPFQTFSFGFELRIVGYFSGFVLDRANNLFALAFDLISVSHVLFLW